MTETDFLRLTLELAAQGKGQVSPNPLVGSVIVRDGKVVGSGFHRYSEIKHAEVWALEEAGNLARGATAYVSLEPCSHNGEGKRTPPCVQALIDAGVQRVVAAMIDPNPKVNGRGFAMLRAAGIEVSTGLMQNEAERLNEKYIRYVTTRLPFVHLKTACSLDGRIATPTGESKWITGEAARRASQHLRGEYDVILTGIGTVLADDPLLSDRSGMPRHRPLMRVVLDAGLRIPPASQIVRTASDLPLIVFASQSEMIDSMGFPISREWGATAEARQKVLESCGVIVIRVGSDGGRLNLTEVLQHLGRLSYSSVLVESGSDLAGSFIDGKLVDKVTFFIAPKIIGGRDALSAIGGQGVEHLAQVQHLKNVSFNRHGDDIEITGYPA
jgi:diaminohydroxyphosphoribosylaminopyrimidine deaminase/5-amino-6-(5-phosphoribosylamino)uracil reductase